MTWNYPRDEKDDEKDCANCGHKKKSHLTVNPTPAGSAYLYKNCRKGECPCERFEPKT